MQWQKFILARVALILLTMASIYQCLHRLGWLAVDHGAVFFLFPGVWSCAYGMLL
jgi:hypothetical protein